ncbi:MAG: hypothetical protein RBS80_13335 [Thermoguttaceae bacterium]|nr:hypothetical protein [Thermoguttaceae bacterium]
MTSSQETPAAGRLVKFALRRASSSFCQSWMGTSSGFPNTVERVPPAVWQHASSAKHVLRQGFSYRQKDRSRPIMGDRRPPSKLGEVQPDYSLAEYTTDLIDLLKSRSGSGFEQIGVRL